MIPVLNAINVHAAVYGNHDFGEFILHYMTNISTPGGGGGGGDPTFSLTS